MPLRRYQKLNLRIESSTTQSRNRLKRGVIRLVEEVRKLFDVNNFFFAHPFERRITLSDEDRYTLYRYSILAGEHAMSNYCLPKLPTD